MMWDKLIIKQNKTWRNNNLIIGIENLKEKQKEENESE